MFVWLAALLILLLFVRCMRCAWDTTIRTKWKRQTAVGLELLAEAGNYAAFQRLYGGAPYLNSWPYPSQITSGVSPTTTDLYYRQAAAVVLQKPLPYRMYPSVQSLGALTSFPAPSSSVPHLSASSSLSTLGSYYHGSTNNNSSFEVKRLNREMRRSCSPTLNPGSPPERLGSSPTSDDDATIQI